MAKLRFSCTSCGRCCHDLRLVLGVGEAAQWVRRGGRVQILCHAAPAVADDGEVARYKRERTFPARSGELAIAVQVILVARFAGACPNLLPDMRCGIYDRRPNVCRVYPAEIIPGMTPDPAHRLCPPEAWSEEQPDFVLDDGSVVDPVTREAIAAARATGLRDVAARRSLVASLGIDVAALENEGFAVWTIDPARLSAALDAAMSDRAAGDADDAADRDEWRFLSRRPPTIDLIAATGAHVADDNVRPDLDYLPLYEDD